MGQLWLEERERRCARIQVPWNWCPHRVIKRSVCEKESKQMGHESE